MEKNISHYIIKVCFGLSRKLLIYLWKWH